ncbi:Dabb family protein [Amnibacterium setariae]|uniref:Dabb family protein n=1 Tax=Amnibacterium setariae TaxID=2306585 RepID=A0A3A1U380_9MICO|nr:Dabb family protein [Amnibacterium setariae]RIX30852.1 Dabb family protein [Amnibacterium setariae]
MTAVRHTVAFALPHPPDSAEEAAFLADARRLATIPGVEGFVVLRADGGELPLALSMEFADRDAYAAYDADPLHRDFVERRWLPTVTAFQEADFAVVPPPSALG